MTVEHNLITDPELHEPKGIAASGIDEVYISDGAGSGSWGIAPSTFDPTTMKSVNLIIATSVAASQEPVAVDTPLQIEFGPAIGTGSDPVQLLADGTVQINQSGTYRFKAQAQLGRTGGTGVSLLFFRATVNGVQSSNSVFEKFDDVDVTQSIIEVTWGDVPAGALIKYELVRDSAGDNSGGLFKTSPTLAGWADAPTASLIIERWEK